MGALVTIGKARPIGAIVVDELLNLRRLRQIYRRVEHFEDRPAAALGARAQCGDFHPFAHPAQAGRQQRLDAVDFDHADAAEPVGRAVVVIADGRYLPAELLRGFENRRPRGHGDGGTVDGECYIRHMKSLWLRAQSFAPRRHEDHEVRKNNSPKPSCPSCLRGESYFLASNISGHNFIALSTAVGAVWPRPQSDASIIVWPTSDKRSRSPASGRPAAAPVKNFILPLGAQLAGITFAAAFVGKEVRQPLQARRADRAVVEDHDCAGAERQARPRSGSRRTRSRPDLSQRQMRPRRRP